MHRLGISVYPNDSNLDETKDYIRLAAKYGFERIFTCLISANDILTDVAENEPKSPIKLLATISF